MTTDTTVTRPASTYTPAQLRAMAAEHDLVGPDAALLLQTTGGSLREQIRVEAFATYLNPLTASDSLECRMRAA